MGGRPASPPTGVDGGGGGGGKHVAKLACCCHGELGLLRGEIKKKRFFVNFSLNEGRIPLFRNLEVKYRPKRFV